MASLLRSLLLFCLLNVAVSSSSSSSNCSGALAVSYPAPVAAEGWAYRLVATNLISPRGILFDAQGSLVVVEVGVGLVRYGVAEGECLAVGNRTVVVENKNLTHGVALSADGSTIFASSAEEVFSWPYDPTASTLSSRRTLITNMSNTDHITRTLLVPQKHPDLLLVSRGSASNEDDAAASKTSGHSQLRSFNITALNATEAPYNFSSSGVLLGWGLRNSVGVAEHPVTGGIWSVENSVDQLQREGKDIHMDNPAEELNFHGYLNGSEPEGSNYGYPRCVALWSTEDFPDLGDLETGDQFPLDYEGDDLTILSDSECRDEFEAPVLSFQAHMAPLDIVFTSNGSEAYISFHGSWNRSPPVGYQIARLTFTAGHPTSPTNSTTALTPILQNANLSACPSQCFRPVGLAFDTSGRLWFSSDATGEIFVLEQNSTQGESSSGDDSAAASTYLPRGGVVGVAVAAAVMGFFLA